MPCVVLQPSSARARLDNDCDSRSAWPRAVYLTKSRDDENAREHVQVIPCNTAVNCRAGPAGGRVRVRAPAAGRQGALSAREVVLHARALHLSGSLLGSSSNSYTHGRRLEQVRS